MFGNYLVCCLLPCHQLLSLLMGGEAVFVKQSRRLDERVHLAAKTDLDLTTVPNCGRTELLTIQVIPDVRFSGFSIFFSKRPISTCSP